MPLAPPATSRSLDTPVRTWLAQGLDLGQTYYACALASEFRRRRGDAWPIHLMVADQDQAAVASLFAGEIAAVHVRPKGASDDGEAETEVSAEPQNHDRNASQGEPIDLSSPPACGERTLDFLLERGLPWGEALKAVLELPPEAGPAVPELSEERRTRGRALLETAGFAPGRTLILLPCPPPLEAHAHRHYAALADSARAAGWTVLQQTLGAAAEIDGAVPIAIPLDILAECAEEAGWVVGVRSGQILVAAHARCRKTVIFPRRWERDGMGLDALDLAHDAYQIVFPLESDQTESFSRRIMALECDGTTRPRGCLTEALVLGRTSGEVITRDFVDDQRGRADPGPVKRGLLAKRPSAMRLMNLPAARSRDLEALRRSALARLVADWGKDGRFYVCRDRAFGFDFFEEVDEISLMEGRFAAARGFHTAIVVGRQGLGPLVGADLAEKILARRTFELGHYQHIGRAVASPSHLAFLNRDRPIELGAFQLIDGWQDLEHWGVWSSGDFSTAKFSVAEPPAAPVTLELDAKLFVSQASGFLHLVVRVNGTEVLVRDVEESQTTLLRITIPPEVLESTTAFLEFEHRGVRSPQALGLGPDPRRLALGLSTANLRHGV